MRQLFRLLFRIRLEGQLPAKGPYLLVANHQGWADAFLLLVLLPIEPRVYFIADRSATMTLWWKRLVLRSLGVVVAVDRDGRSERGAIDASLRILQRGAVLGLFPEGRVSRAEGQLGPFHRGIGYLALKAGVPVVPVWLRGTAELYLGRELVVRVGAVRRPVPEPPTRKATERLATQLHEDLVALAEPWSEPVGAIKHWRWLTDIL
jgi:1-acyl-sn-glycerol-3-phosphate acyltransferase